MKEADVKKNKILVLNDFHEKLGARMMDFHAWRMPLLYESIVKERDATRKDVGVFDVSHMGQISIEGEGSQSFLNHTLSANAAKLQRGQCQYSFMLNAKGGVIDDLILYFIDEEKFLLVVNAGKVQEVLANLHILRDEKFSKIKISDQSLARGALAVQGKNASKIYQNLRATFPNFPVDLPKRNCLTSVLNTNGRIDICRTGYTGEDGFEIFYPEELAQDLFGKIITAGANACGLGARDLLRLEMCYPLNGAELSPKRTPLEAGLGFAVDLNKDVDFVGKDALLAQKAKGLSSKLAAIKCTTKSPPARAGYKIFARQDGEAIGEFTSAATSRELGAFGLAYLPVEYAKIGTQHFIGIRDKFYPVQTVQKPFIKI